MRFEPNRSVETRQPTVIVDAGLPRGRHRFRLEVVNARGQRSQPADVIVTVTGRRPPARRSRGRSKG